MKTVTIVGGGLAGLATGLGLRRMGVPAVIHEAGAYPRHRVCGEFIAGLDDSTRDTLGLAPFLADAPLHETMLWHIRDKPFGRSRIPRPAIGISRFALDSRMAGAFVEAGGDLRERSRVDPLHGAEGWIDATGRHPSAGGWVGMKLHVRDFETRSDLEFHLGHNAYVGASRTESGAVNVCGLFRPPIAGSGPGAGRFVAHLEACGLRDLAKRLRAASVVPGSFCSVAGLAYAIRPSARRALSVGDSAGLIPPFTGDGMAIAFQSAAAALEPLRDYSSGVCDWQTAEARIRSATRRKFRVRLGAAAILHPLLTHPTGQASLAALQRAGLIPFGAVFQTLH